MVWWQSLLIAMIPAFIAGFISWIIAWQQLNNSKEATIKQIENAKKEIEEKYAKERELHIKKAQFDKEFIIYQDLLEKLVRMVIDCGNLFPMGLMYLPSNPKELNEFHKKVFEQSARSHAEAHIAIFKNSAFIPEKIFDKFNEVQSLCSLQKSWFAQKNLLKNPVEPKTITECFSRTKEIEDKTESLIKELREYLASLNNKEKSNG